jgi:MFS family permease
VVDQGLHKPVTFLGLLQSAMGVGAVIGGVLITSLIRRTGELRPVSVGIGLVAAGSALSMAPSAWVVAGAMVLIGAGLPVTVICITTILQRRTPSPIQGRVFTTFEMLTGVPQVTSIAVGSALVAFVDFRVLLTVMAVGLALAAAYAALRLREDGTSAPLDVAEVDTDVPVVGTGVRVELSDQASPGDVARLSFRSATSRPPR